jgi:hypothetical protein
MESSAA